MPVGFAEDLRIVDGPVLWAAWAAGTAGALYLMWPLLRALLRPRHSQRTPVIHTAIAALAAVIVAAGLVLGVHWLLVYVFFVFPDVLPSEVLAWSVPAVAAPLLALYRGRGLLRAGPRPARRLRVVTAAAAACAGVLALSAVQINAYFGLNRTVGDLTGSAIAGIQSLDPATARGPGDHPLAGLSGWTPSRALPATGLVRKATIPGTVSGFHSRDAYVYLPPAYQDSPRPALPVLVLFAGQPGGPADWLTGGALRSGMDRFASAHRGLAPVVVVVDPNGSANGNTLCMDSRIAQADTFLARDVPAWIRATLDVDPDPGKWAAGGFSFGATCAVQMVTRHPGIYSAALAFSSEQEPALAKDRHRTIEASFGGDTAAFERRTPLQLMRHRRFDGNALYLAAGVRDHQFVGYLNVLAGAARQAGFSVRERLIPGVGHSWEVAANGLGGGLDFLAPRWGITQ